MGFCRILFQLPPDVGHIYPQDAVVVVGIGSPYIGNDGVIGNDFAGIAGKEGNNFEFDLGQVDIFSVQGDEAFFEVDDQPFCPIRPLV